MKKVIVLALGIVMTISCLELQQVANQLPTSTTGIASDLDISNGLKQALEMGVQTGVKSLSEKDGFLTNELVKVVLPPELKKVDKTLRSVGLGKLSDEGLKLLNRAAEDAVVEAAPIFTNAIKTMSFNDAKGILMGGKSAATNYLKNKTTNSLVQSFSPKVKASLGKVGADKVWSNIIKKYNTLNFGNKINPDLNQYVTEQTMNGLFKMVAQKEDNIRTRTTSRTTSLLQKVFAMQDKK